ncbi:hypothetical protein [Actinomadura chokoriensis]|uniref:hypothetical protein n=1 Tax=Actinomadura chokoriensis TaxID=454156 RepID=UPI0031F90E41
MTVECRDERRAWKKAAEESFPTTVHTGGSLAEPAEDLKRRRMERRLICHGTSSRESSSSRSASAGRTGQQGKITVPVVVEFDELGAAKPVPVNDQSGGDARGWSRWGRPVAWALGGFVLPLIAVLRLRRR